MSFPDEVGDGVTVTSYFNAGSLLVHLSAGIALSVAVITSLAVAIMGMKSSGGVNVSLATQQQVNSHLDGLDVPLNQA